MAAGARRSPIPALLAAVLAFAAPEGHEAAAQEGAAPPSAAVPNYWDPAHRRQKPDLSERRRVRFLTEFDAPPFSFVGADGLPTGFHVELARAICGELTVSCTVQSLRWDILLEGIDRGFGDAILASVAVTPETVQRYDFTGRYMMRPARFVAHRDAALEIAPEALAGTAVAVVEDTAHAAYLRAFFADADIRPFEDDAAARRALVDGEVEALFGDGLNLSLWLNAAASERCCAFRGGSYTETRYFGEGFAVAVERGDAELREAIEYALARLQQTGAFAEIYRRYFPLSFY